MNGTPSFHTILLVMAVGLVWDELLAMQDEPMPRRLLQINSKSSFYTLFNYPGLDFHIHQIHGAGLIPRAERPLHEFGFKHLS